MLDSPQELLDKIRLGEDSSLELKELRLAGNRVHAPSQESLADELAAFANGRGGVLVLGVEDNTREIVGIPLDRLDAVEDFVRRVCNDSIRPSLVPYIERLTLPATTGEEKAVLKVEVDRSLFVHQSPGGYFHRVGSSKRAMPPEYLARLFQQRSQTRLIRFDEQTVPGATLDDLDTALWERFRTDLSEDDRETFLHKLAIARQDEDGTWRPTVAGVLMAAKDPRRWMPNAFIQAVAYRGTEARPPEKDSFYQLDAADLSGPLDAQVIEACRFVYRNMRVEATKTLGRRDYPQYHLGAVFEAIVNAVAHRDYAIYGSKVRLRLFADRLELYSPGALANTMDLDSLPYRQSARNEALTSLLAKCPIPRDLEWLQTKRRTLMDRRGEGVALILRESENLSGRRPKYDLYGESELVLTIYAASAPRAEADS
jgi:predicted HTH transcriptional regulator